MFARHAFSRSPPSLLRRFPAAAFEYKGLRAKTLGLASARRTIELNFETRKTNPRKRTKKRCSFSCYRTQTRLFLCSFLALLLFVSFFMFAALSFFSALSACLFLSASFVAERQTSQLLEKNSEETRGKQKYFLLRLDKVFLAW